MTDPVVEPATSPMFVALASLLAAIEVGTIEEGEVESCTSEAGLDVTLTVTVRRKVRHLVAGPDGD